MNFRLQSRWRIRKEFQLEIILLNSNPYPRDNLTFIFSSEIS